MKTFLTEATITNPIIPKQQENQDDYDYFFQLTQNLNKISRVIFALYAAKLVKNSDQRTTNCLNLIEKWLKNPDSVNKTELRDASYGYTIANAVDADFAMAYAAYTAYYANWASGAAFNAAYAAFYAIHAGGKAIRIKLLNYISYLLPKEPEHNNFNHNFLRQNQQAYKFLEKISKLEDWQVTNDDLIGIYHVFDALEEAGMPIDLSEFQWEGENSVYNDITEKHRLLQAIRREFNEH